MSRLAQIEPEELKNTPCILVINANGRQEEQAYYSNCL